MAEQIRISAKNLGELALPGFCPRCFWLKLKLKNRLPFQIFPGIFSSIDSYTKNIIHAWFDRYGTAPPWLAELGELCDYVEPPPFSRFSIVDEESDILLTGVPDGIFVRPNGAYIIVDYKTARYTGAQDSLFPMYEVQLNGYALIGNARGFNPVSDLALVYMEPVTDKELAIKDESYREDGFILGFSPKIHKVELNPGKIFPLLRQVREIYEQPVAPPCSPSGCKDCDCVSELIKLANLDIQDI